MSTALKQAFHFLCTGYYLSALWSEKCGTPFLALTGMLTDKDVVNIWQLSEKD